MGEIITLELVKEHLRIEGTAADAALLKCITRAEKILWGHIGLRDASDWYATHGEDFSVLEAPLLLMVEELHDRSTNKGDPLTAAVKSLLRRFRNPVISEAE